MATAVDHFEVLFYLTSKEIFAAIPIFPVYDFNLSSTSVFEEIDD